MDGTGAAPRQPKSYAISRTVRLLLFSFVVSALIVAVALVAFQFIYNEIAEAANLNPYAMRVELIVPAMLLVTVVFFRLIKENSEGAAKKP